MLASAGDDGNVLFWTRSEKKETAIGDEDFGDKEFYHVRHMCRSMGSEIYDLAWSPDGLYIATGSMDNTVRVYDSTDGSLIRQMAEHSHYVQGIAWDPLNEYLATQSSDRSVHVWRLNRVEKKIGLTQYAQTSRIELPQRKIPTPSTGSHQTTAQQVSNQEVMTETSAFSEPATPLSPFQHQYSPLPSNPHPTKTMTTTANTNTTSTSMNMHPPSSAITHSRRSSQSNSEFTQSPVAGPIGGSLSRRRSSSPASVSNLPLPAIKPIPAGSPKTYALNTLSSLSKAQPLYHTEALISFFRRLTFTIDGSLLLTPSGLLDSDQCIPLGKEAEKTEDKLLNTVFIYTRAGLNKPPIAHLPCHKKPSIAVACSPVYYKLRPDGSTKPSTILSIDTSSEMDIPSLPPPSAEPAIKESQENNDDDKKPPFSLPYRMVYAVATQDAIMVYDTQQQLPLCIVSNLHYATFTDLCWATDGQSLVMTSTDGFASMIVFDDELGEVISKPNSIVPEKDKTEKADKTDRIEKPDETDKAEKTEKIDKSEKAVKTDTTDKMDMTAAMPPTLAGEVVEEEKGPKRRKIAPTFISHLER